MPNAPAPHRPAGWKAPIPWKKDNDQRKLTGRPWRRLREQAMVRDRWLCQPCLEVGLVTEAVECDHVVPVSQGGSDDLSNLRAICHRCHGIKTAVEGQAQGKDGTAHPTWLPAPACAVVLVTGPPGGGKTTYCKAKATHSDVVIDLDECFKDVCGTHGHEADRKYLPAALRWRNKQLADLSIKRIGTAFFIVSCPTDGECQWWVDRLNASHVLIDPGKDVCMARLDGTRKQAAQHWYETKAINQWQRFKGA